MAAPLYTSGAPLLQAGGVSGDSALYKGPGAAAAPIPIAPTGKSVNVVSPDGQVYGLDEAHLPRAISEGFKLESAEQAGLRRFVEANKGLSGDARVGIANFADEATFGVSGAIGRKILEKSADPYALAKWQALKADHDVANAVGGVAGFGASLLYGGEFFGLASKAGGGVARKVLGKAAAEGIETAVGHGVAAEMAYRAPGITAAEATKVGPGIARRILASSADMGTQGLMLSAPKAITEAMLGDPERAAETWFYGATGGAVLGLAGGAIAGTARKVVTVGEGGLGEKAAAGLRKFGDDQAVSAYNLTKPFTKKLTQRKLMGEAATVSRDLDLAQHAGNHGAIAEALHTEQGTIGERLGAAWGVTGDRPVMSLREFEEAAQKVLVPETGAKIGKVQASETVFDWFRKEFAPLVTSSEERGGLTLKEAHDARVVLDKSTKWDGTVSNEVNELRKELRDAVTALIEPKLDATGKELGRDLLAQVRADNRRYATLKILADGTRDRVAASAANSRHGLFGFMGNQVGATVGGFVGGGVGSVVGGLVGGEATNLLRRYGPSYLSQGAHALADRIQGRGLVALEAAHAHQGEALALIPQALDTMAAGKKWDAGASAKTQGVNILTHLLGADDHDLSTSKGVMTFADKLASLSTNPAKMQEHIEGAVAPLTGDAPEVAMAASIKLPQVVAYLAGAAPKQPNVQSPFEPKTPWAPSGADLAAFRVKVKTALNPHSAIDALANGTLTAAHIEALQAVAPRIYQEMQRRIMEHGGSGNAKPLNHAQRLKLSLLTGVPLDRSLAQIAGYQEVFAAAPQPAQGKAMKIKPPTPGDIARISGS